MPSVLVEWGVRSKVRSECFITLLIALIIYASSPTHLPRHFPVLMWFSKLFEYFLNSKFSDEQCRHAKDVVILTLVALSWISLVRESFPSAMR
jgi:hypothetical protein